MRRERLVVALVVVAAFGSCFELVSGNSLSIHPRATSSYGRRAAACLSTSEGDACRWTGWQSADRLKTMCPALACLKTINDGRYVLGRSPDDDVVAVAVHTTATLRGDLWLGRDGTALHCVDTTRRPGFIAHAIVGDDRHRFTRRDADPRCDRVGAVPPLDGPAGALTTPVAP